MDTETATGTPATDAQQIEGLTGEINELVKMGDALDEEFAWRLSIVLEDLKSAVDLLKTGN